MTLIGICTHGLSRTEAVKSCLQHYPRYSWKRRLALAWNIVSLCIAPNQRDKSVPDEKYFRHLEAIKSIGLTPRAFTLSFKFLEKSRLYTYTFDKKKKCEAFLKTTFNRDDHINIAEEKAALDHLNIQEKDFLSPSVLGVARKKNQFLLAQTAIPKGFVAVKKTAENMPLGLLQSLKNISAPSNVANAKLLSWWSNFIQHANTDSTVFLREMLLREVNIATHFAHGDFISENVFQNSEGSYLLIDWEFCAYDAPRYTDLVGYWIGTYYKEILQHKDDHYKIGALIKENLLNTQNISYVDLAWVLAFLVSRKIVLAFHLADSLFYLRHNVDWSAAQA